MTGRKAGKFWQVHIHIALHFAICTGARYATDTANIFLGPLLSFPHVSRILSLLLVKVRSSLNISATSSLVRRSGQGWEEQTKK